MSSLKDKRPTLRNLAAKLGLGVSTVSQALRDSPEIAAATKIWRKMYASEEQLARDGLAFMKAQVAARW